MLVVVNFNAVDADTGKSGNGAYDAGAANAAIVGGIASSADAALRVASATGSTDAGLGEIGGIDRRSMGIAVIFCECADGIKKC